MYPFPEEIQGWMISHSTRVLSILVPIVSILLIYRWKIGILDWKVACIALLLLPLELLPWVARTRSHSRTHASKLLGMFSKMQPEVPILRG
jgi:hypothetical protein